ncbi:hypothetical protein [Nocardioides sp. PD653]|uniref:hypothetical protein n=1 Tax=Nocardioides sp. PD653 TaxID=393303 RepID=UPI0009F02869|nr:hypothetical protein [Nocardioides sp. PD653]GAW54781.1 hypothetical protein PD653_2195 [Nocardioides sp. PD653]
MDAVVEHRSSWWFALTTPSYRDYRVLVSCRACGVEEWGLTAGRARRHLAQRHTSAECEQRAKERAAENAWAEAEWDAYLAEEEAWRDSVRRRFSVSDRPSDSTGGGR